MDEANTFLLASIMRVEYLKTVRIHAMPSARAARQPAPARTVKFSEVKPESGTPQAYLGYCSLYGRTPGQVILGLLGSEILFLEHHNTN